MFERHGQAPPVAGQGVVPEHGVRRGVVREAPARGPVHESLVIADATHPLLSGVADPFKSLGRVVAVVHIGHVPRIALRPVQQRFLSGSRKHQPGPPRPAVVRVPPDAVQVPPPLLPVPVVV